MEVEIGWSAGRIDLAAAAGMVQVQSLLRTDLGRGLELGLALLLVLLKC